MNYPTPTTVIVGIGVTSCIYAAFVILKKYLKKHKKPETLDDILRRILIKRSELKKRLPSLSSSDEAHSSMLKDYAWHSLRLEDEEFDDDSLKNVLEASCYAEKYLKIGQIEEVHVRGIHGHLMHNSYMAGQLRNHDVSIGGINYQRFPPPYEEVPQLFSEFISWLNLNKLSSSPKTIVKIAAVAYLKFITFHPFLKENGRVARALFNGLIRQYGYPWVVIKSTSTDKYEYYQSMQYYFKNGDVTPFCLYMAKCVDSALDQVLKTGFLK